MRGIRVSLSGERQSGDARTDGRASRCLGGFGLIVRCSTKRRLSVDLPHLVRRLRSRVHRKAPSSLPNVGGIGNSEALLLSGYELENPFADNDIGIQIVGYPAK